MLRNQIRDCIDEVEAQLGHELPVARALVDEEPELAFEQLCIMVDDEPIALTEEQLERLRGIADDFQNPKERGASSPRR